MSPINPKESGISQSVCSKRLCHVKMTPFSKLSLSCCASFCNVWKRKTRAPARRDYLVSRARVTITSICAGECNFAEYKNTRRSCEKHPVFLSTEKRINLLFKDSIRVKKERNYPPRSSWSFLPAYSSSPAPTPIYAATVTVSYEKRDF